MEHRILGKTGLSVSKLGLGAASLGGVYGGMSQDDANRLVRAAIDNGINLIDTSPYYGVTRSESVLGEALRGVPRDSFLMATKCGRYGDDDFDFSADRILRSVDESLQRLGLETIDIFQAHDIEFRSLEQVVQETVPALQKLKQQGKVRFIGVTGLPLKIFRYVLSHHDLDTIISYSHYTLVDQSLTELLPLLQEKQVGVMNASPVALGLLSEHGPQPWHPAPADLKAHVAQVVAKWKLKGVSLAKLSLQQSMANPDIPCTLGGMATIPELESSLAAAAEPLDRELLAEILKDFEPVKNRTWVQGRLENN